MEQASDVVELVLPHEVDNPNNVYLYLEGDAWCAYERSAYYPQNPMRKSPPAFTADGLPIAGHLHVLRFF